MNILINGDNVDFKLEYEKNLFDVVQSIKKWLSVNSQVLEQLKVDGKIVNNSDNLTLKNSSINSVTNLELEIKNIYDFAIDLLESLDLYITRFESILGKPDFSNLKDMQAKEQILDGLAWIRNVIEQVLSSFNIDLQIVFCVNLSLRDVLSRLISFDEDLRKNKLNDYLFNSIFRDNSKDIISDIKPFVLKLIYHIILQYPNIDKDIDRISILKTCLSDFISSLDSFSDIISRITSFLQTGKELEAYVDIKNLLGILGSLIFYLDLVKNNLNISYDEWIIDGKPVEQENKELSLLMENIFEVFSNRDIVLLGDLLEYELIDKLKKYKKIFQECIVIMNKKNYN